GARQPRDATGFVGVDGSGGVGQHQVSGGVDELEDVRASRRFEVHAAERHRDHLRPGSGDGVAHDIERPELARPHDQSGRERPSGDDQWIVWRHPVSLREHYLVQVPRVAGALSPPLSPVARAPRRSPKYRGQARRDSWARATSSSRRTRFQSLRRTEKVTSVNTWNTVNP